MKITQCKPYKYKDGVAQRVMISFVMDVTKWVRGKKVKRKESFTRHLRLIPYSEEFMGTDPFNRDLKVYGKLEFGEFVFLKHDGQPILKVSKSA